MIKFRNLSTFYFLLSTRNAGQSLVEILIGLSIGSLLIGASSIAIIGILRSSVSTQNQQASSAFNQETLDRTRSFSNSNWNDLNTLTKGSGTNYFLNASGSTFSVITGKDGIIDNDVLSGLVARWGFDEATSTTAASTYDASGNNNTGNMIGGVLRATSTCKISTCFSFDGTNDYVDGGTITNLNPTGTLTVSAWVKWNSVATTGGGGPQIVGRRTSANVGGYTIDWDVANNKLCFYVYTNTWTGACKTGTPSSNIWYYYVGTYNGSQVKLFINGSEDATQAQTGSINVPVTNVEIGRNTIDPTTNRYFSGEIDEVRVYNRALSANEIQRMYESSRYTRYFAIENVCRTNDSSSTISGTGSCIVGSVNDPLTQQITAYTEWTPPGGSVYQSSVVDYITRTKNSVFHQTDWSGGTGQTSVVTNVNNKFASSSNVATSTIGSFRIQGL